jgi:hypothetical protein
VAAQRRPEVIEHVRHARVMLGMDGAPVSRALARRETQRPPLYLSLMEGMKDALQRRHLARRWSDWRPEILWMSLYFSAGVWLSFCLVFV